MVERYLLAQDLKTLKRIVASRAVDGIAYDSVGSSLGKSIYYSYIELRG